MKLTKMWAAAPTFLVLVLLAFGGMRADCQATAKMGKELVIWHQADTPQSLGALEKVIALFESENPGVKVKYQLMDMQNMKQSMSTAVPSGLGPDIFGSSVGAYLWSVIDGGLLYDLTDAYARYKWEDRIVPWAKPYVKYKNRYWSVPNEAEIVALFFYNTDVFAKKGLAVPKDWDELLTLIEKLKGVGDGPTVAAPGGLVQFNSHWEAMMWGVSVPQQVLEKTCFQKGSWLQPEYERGMTLLKDFNDRLAWGKDFTAVKYPEALSLFMTGKSPMLLNGSWALNALTADPNLRFDFFVPPPVKGVKGRPAINCGSGWQISAKAKNPAAAIKFLDLAISSRADTIWLENCQWMPPTKVDTSKVKLNAYQKKVLGATLAPEAAYSMFNIIPEDVNKAMWAKMQEMYLGKASPKDVLQTKQRNWETAISEGRVPDPR